MDQPSTGGTHKVRNLHRRLAVQLCLLLQLDLAIERGAHPGEQGKAERQRNKQLLGQGPVQGVSRVVRRGRDQVNAAVLRVGLDDGHGGLLGRRRTTRRGGRVRHVGRGRTHRAGGHMYGEGCLL